MILIAIRTMTRIKLTIIIKLRTKINLNIKIRCLIKHNFILCRFDYCNTLLFGI